MTKQEHIDPLEGLAGQPAPRPREEARAAALAAALAAFDENSAAAPKASVAARRPSTEARTLWSRIMNRRFLTAPAFASLIALPIAGIGAFWLMETSPVAIDRARDASPVAGPKPGAPANQGAPAYAPAEAATEAETQRSSALAQQESYAVQKQTFPTMRPTVPAGAGAAPSPAISAAPAPSVDAFPDAALQRAEARDRFEAFRTNPVRLAAEDPVSTFSIDVDTASYAWARRSLKEGVLPQPDTVRVEEMINYFPYDWPAPASAEEPFRPTVTVMPTPWNAGTKLIHVAIKGYELAQAAKPKANLVFLIDVSGSMDEPDKLPLLRSSFRMLVNTLSADDTISIVTYAGNAGTVLEPTKGSQKATILAAIDRLEPGGSTAGEAGLREAYRLAQSSYVEGGVNRVLLATDGDFNVGQSDDEDLKRLIEDKRRSGVFLSVFGFGRGNLNDRMMQTIAQNGNGTAAYIDTLAEAEKALVQEAGSTLFPIAKDVKIQVEFNPRTVAEYRLIGYETRALAREDFNDDRVDAGEIGSGHSVTAIYEITPTGSPARQVDDLRYGQASTENGGIANADEYAFVKIRYKLPDGDASRLIEMPVTEASEIARFDEAGADQRFSVAVAAFGQKLRGTGAVEGISYEQIATLAAAARGTDPFGYRAEFLSLLRLAAGLDGRR